MTYRQTLLAMTATAGLCTLPVLALAQGGGSSMQPQATTQQGGPSTSATPRDGAPINPPSTGTMRPADAVNRGAPDGTRGNPPSTATQRAADSVTGNRTPPDGTPGNPPGTAVGRAVEGVTGGNRPDGTPGNPPGTAVGRAVDSATGGNRPDGTPGNPPGTAAGRALGTGTTGTAPAGAAAVGAAAGAVTSTMAVDSAALRNGRRASKVIGATVYNENNESIGEVDDIMIPASGGAPVAVISVGGFLGIGAKLVAVPYDRLQMNNDRNRWTMSGASKDSLTGLPTFSYDTANNTRG